MISKKEYEEAQNIVWDYEDQILKINRMIKTLKLKNRGTEINFCGNITDGEIKIKRDKEIENDTVKLFDKSHNLIGIIESGLQMQDICLQIKKNKIVGYYFMFNGQKTIIEKDGRAYFKTNRPFNAMGDILRELI